MAHCRRCRGGRQHDEGSGGPGLHSRPMKVFDAASDPGLMETVGLLRRVSEAEEPMQVQREFARDMRFSRGIDGYVSVSVRGLEPGRYKITRHQVLDALGQPWPNPWENWHEMTVHSGGFLGEIIATSTPKLMWDINVRDDPVLGDSVREMRSCLAIPLFDGGRALNWGVFFRRDPRGWKVDEIENIVIRGNLIGRMTKQLLVAKQVKELNARLTAQLEEIAQIQRSLLPSQLPQIPGISLAASYLTSNEAGGDYYDFFEMGHGKWGVIVADVSGHGAGAATVMAMLQTILHGFDDRTRGPAAMLTHANRELCRKRFESNFVTAFMGVLDADRRTLIYSNAGHNRPELRRSTGGVRAIDGATSVPLGILDDAQYEEAELSVQPRDTMVLYTDGITEAFGPPPEREMFGVDRLTEALEDCTGEPSCVIDSIHERLYSFTRARTRQDDQTIVAMRIEH